MAVIDAYAGTLNGTLNIEADGEKRRGTVEMKIGLQVLLPSGNYQIDLKAASGESIHSIDPRRSFTSLKILRISIIIMIN